MSDIAVDLDERAGYPRKKSNTSEVASPAAIDVLTPEVGSGVRDPLASGCQNVGCLAPMESIAHGVQVSKSGGAG